MRPALSYLLVLALLGPSQALASASGSLDPFFGLSGRDTVRSSTYYTPLQDTGGLVLALDGSPVPLARAARGLVLPDGRLVTLNSPVRFEYDLCRSFIGDGRDPTFGDGTGCVAPAFPGAGGSFAAPGRQSDGKLLMAGWIEYPLYTIYVARYSADGILDTTFGTGGITLISFGSGLSARANALVVQPDDRIIVGGPVTNDAFIDFTTRAWGLARLDANGALDPSFGTGGLVTTTFGVRPDLHGLALQADGRIVAVG